MKEDLQEILFSEEVLTAKIKELADRISEDYKGKDLIVYYITSEGAKEEHEVIVKDGYASFETNHFSTYVLAEKAEENPKTYDGIINSIFAGSISLIGLVCVIIYLKKRSNVKGY